MRTTRNFVVGIVAWLFSSVEVKANASLYSHEWHPDSQLSATYMNRIAQSSTSLALNKHGGWSRPSDNRKRFYLNRPPPRSFDRMNPAEKIVSGPFRVFVDGIEDYFVGFCIGLTAGALFELPKALLRSSGERAADELGARALLWARQTGEFMGSFRGCATAVRLVRSPKRDDWNIVYGCATAGAFMGRNRK